ncbi:hypothetical protein Ae201684_008961 [Aphanomyces euteiches]|uniref:Uncharacterized protein n=1 Tax=Aphanomyces euteiches TaxID=100861 RepID=A0A6G0X3F0_9STRA|nr:hypothetical protein Ae201684_008961 [Aphanomyces euteiches]
MVSAGNCNFRDGDVIALKADNGLYFSTCRNCIYAGDFTDSITLQDSFGATYAFWTVVNTGNGKIALKGDTGKFVARCNNCVQGALSPDEAFVSAADSKSSPLAQFTCEDASNGKIALKADTGKYLAHCKGCVPRRPAADVIIMNATNKQIKLIQVSYTVFDGQPPLLKDIVACLQRVEAFALVGCRRDTATVVHKHAEQSKAGTRKHGAKHKHDSVGLGRLLVDRHCQHDWLLHNRELSVVSITPVVDMHRNDIRWTARDAAIATSDILASVSLQRDLAVAGIFASELGPWTRLPVRDVDKGFVGDSGTWHTVVATREIVAQTVQYEYGVPALMGDWRLTESG